MKITVLASEADVIAVLKQNLSESEFNMLQFEAASDDSPLSPAPRRADPLNEVGIWFASAMASGLAYDLAKSLSTKVWDLLVQKFGEKKVKKSDDPG